MYSVLIVDDEPLTRQYLKINIPILHSKWRVAAEASDGQEALDVLKTTHIDLIVTDIKMPVMSGLELIKTVSEANPTRKVVILSGYDEFSLAKEAIRYGVNEYLLKPIVKEELTAVLERIAAQLDIESTEQLAYTALKNVSEESKKQVAKHFLSAVVSDNSVEIKALYPLVFRWKVSFIEAEGAVMILDLDEHTLLEKNISRGEISVFKYILQQVTTELTEHDPLVKVFVDQEQTTNILVTGDSEDQLLLGCRELYANVRRVMLEMTGITVSGAVGCCENDVLLLNLSYRRARNLLKHRLFSDSDDLFLYENRNDIPQRLQALDKAISAILSALYDSSEVNLISAIRHYVGLIPDLNRTGVALKYGLYLLRSLEKSPSGFPGEQREGAWTVLKSFASSGPAGSRATAEDTAALLNRMTQRLIRSEPPDLPASSENDLITQAKNYIQGHYAEPLSLALIAERIGLSSGYLSNLFHKSCGESYIKYVTRVRMEQAALYLQAKPAIKVYDVSERVGYVSVKHFSYVFKQHFQIPPGEYQERHLK